MQNCAIFDAVSVYVIMTMFDILQVLVLNSRGILLHNFGENVF